jgi:hypothetical protein
MRPPAIRMAFTGGMVFARCRSALASIPVIQSGAIGIRNGMLLSIANIPTTPRITDACTLTCGANARRPDAILIGGWVEAADRDGVSGDSNRLRLLVNSLSEIGPRRKESHLYPHEFGPNSTASDFCGSLPAEGEPCGGARDPGQDAHRQAGVEASGANLQTPTAPGSPPGDIVITRCVR